MPPYRPTSLRRIIIQIDGSCSRNGQVGARGGIGVHFPNGEIQNISEPLQGARQTNQRAEIQAATSGINKAREAGYNNITVQTDSAYVKNATKSWMPKWEKGGWQQKVTNEDAFKELNNSMKGVNVYFEWIPREQNGEADRLAKNAAKED